MAVASNSHRSVVVICMVAAMGGLIFGYDLGITGWGGVTSMDPFLEKFFPSAMGRESMYGVSNSQLLTLFTSSLYLAALVASFVASAVTTSFGRRISMLVGGLAFSVGSLLSGSAINVAMLVIGRLLLGLGVGFTNQSVPLYVSEMAPPMIRGTLSMCFQMAIVIGVMLAYLVNYCITKTGGDWGWRISLGFGAVPAAMFTVGAIFFLPDTPNSLLQRGHCDEALRILTRVRDDGADVASEFYSIVEASAAAKLVERPWRNILRLRKHRPQLAICILVPFFQQMTGFNVAVVYFPNLFKMIGTGEYSLPTSVFMIVVIVPISIVWFVYFVDRVGRKYMFRRDGIQMLIGQVSTGMMLAMKLSVLKSVMSVQTFILFFLIFLYIDGFLVTWGPLGWLVPSEVCPLEIRPAGQAVNVSVNMFFMFLLKHLFPSMLGTMKFGVVFFFAVFAAIMTLFSHFFLPETMHIPIENMDSVWKAHSFWNKFVPEDDRVSVSGDDGREKNIVFVKIESCSK